MTYMTTCKANPVPVSHVELIYTQSKEESTLRKLAIDCICRNGPRMLWGFKQFLIVVQKNHAFQTDIWGKIPGSSSECASVMKAVEVGKYSLMSLTLT